VAWQNEIVLVRGLIGEGAQSAQDKKMNELVGASFNTMQVMVNTANLPLDYFFGCVMVAMDDDVLALTCNLTDMLNKTLKCQKSLIFRVLEI
jgi:hypothetical protein